MSPILKRECTVAALMNRSQFGTRIQEENNTLTASISMNL
jgi:hypothetical protein